jgi:hypothetical protein
VDYVLYLIAAVALLFVYGAVWTAGGQTARMVLSLGAYTFHPAYMPPSRRWRLARIEARRGHVRPADNFPSWHQHFADLHSLPTTVLRTSDDRANGAAPPMLVQAEMNADGSDSGAEHWGRLLADMNTEERTVYNAQMVMDHEAAMTIERQFLADLDELAERFQKLLDEHVDQAMAAHAGVMANVTGQLGGAERWATGQFPIYAPETV